MATVQWRKLTRRVFDVDNCSKLQVKNFVHHQFGFAVAFAFQAGYDELVGEEVEVDGSQQSWIQGFHLRPSTAILQQLRRATQIFLIQSEKLFIPPTVSPSTVSLKKFKSSSVAEGRVTLSYSPSNNYTNRVNLVK